MRRFTKSHNDLKWLFPVAKTKKTQKESLRQRRSTLKTWLTPQR